MTHAYKSDPSYQELLDTIDDQKKKYNCLFDRYDRLDDHVTQLEGELRRLRDLVGEDDVSIIDEVLDA